MEELDGELFVIEVQEQYRKDGIYYYFFIYECVILYEFKFDCVFKFV